jgi:hypothetical protein
MHVLRRFYASVPLDASENVEAVGEYRGMLAPR